MLKKYDRINISFLKQLTSRKALFAVLLLLKKFISFIYIVLGDKSKIVSRILRYGIVILLNCLIVAVKISVPTIFGQQPPYLSGILVAALATYLGGWKPGTFSIILSLLLNDYFFTTPNKFSLLDNTFLISTLSYIIESFLIVLVISRLREIQDKEHRERQKFEITLSSIGDAVIATDKSGVITFINPIAEQLTAWKYTEAVGKKFERVFQIINESDRTVVKNPVKIVLETSQVTDLRSHTLLIRKDGREIPVSDCASPIKDIKDRMIGVVIVFRDISNQKQTEEQRELLLGVTGHELKNIIAGMKAYIQLLHIMMAKANLSEPLTYMEKLENKINVLTQILNDLIDLTKIRGSAGIASDSSFNLRTLIDDIVEEYRESNKKVIIRSSISENIQIAGEKTKISQVLINLITNAIKYSEGMTKIDILARKVNGWELIGVRDHGLGIPKDRLENLFKPFNRAGKENQTSVTGSGLGLYISSQIIKQHGGKIWTKSREGKGSTFYFTLPLYKKSYQTKQKTDVNQPAVKRIRLWLEKHF